MKKNHGKLFWGIFLIVTLAVISLCVYLATRQSRAKQTARLVLEQIVAETEEPDIERYRETYQKYFTEEAFESALMQRTFSKIMRSVESQSDISSGQLEPELICLETVKESKDDCTFYAVIQLKNHSGAESAGVLERKATMRVILEEGAWKVDYLVIKAG